MVLADYKVADIGFRREDEEWSGTNARIVRALAEAGADYITCHTITGISSIEESVAAAHANGTKVLTLPYMTHRGADLFFGMPIDKDQREHIKESFERYGLTEEDNPDLHYIVDDVESVTELIILLGTHFNVDGHIGPGNNPDVLNTYRRLTGSAIWSPGFGRQSEKTLEEQITEWAEIVGPNSAMIVGSLIYRAQNPAKAAREVKEIRNKVIAELS